MCQWSCWMYVLVSVKCLQLMFSVVGVVRIHIVFPEYPNHWSISTRSVPLFSLVGMISLERWTGHWGGCFDQGMGLAVLISVVAISVIRTCMQACRSGTAAAAHHLMRTETHPAHALLPLAAASSSSSFWSQQQQHTSHFLLWVFGAMLQTSIDDHYRRRESNTELKMWTSCDSLSIAARAGAYTWSIYPLRRRGIHNADSLSSQHPYVNL